MKHLLLAMRLDLAESLRSRWFLIQGLIFGGLVVVLLAFGLTESRVMGFTGLSRFLVTYIQVCMAVLPLFILIVTVRTVVADRESGALEYMLALPISLSAWFWGKFVGRLVLVVLPVLAGLGVGIAYAVAHDSHGIPWAQVAYYSGLVLSLSICFLGLGLLLSSLARSSEVALGLAFLLWLVLLAFLDLILLGWLIQERFASEFIVGIALANPLQVFRTGAMILFDPQLVLLGPSAYVILDTFGRDGYVLMALLYPLALGVVAGALGFVVFRRRDLV